MGCYPGGCLQTIFVDDSAWRTMLLPVPLVEGSSMVLHVIMAEHQCQHSTQYDSEGTDNL